MLLARRLPGVGVVVGADRLAAGRWAVAHLRPDVVLLDDGFQQRRLLKDVEIVCLDARAPWGPGGLFPRGTLREPPSALARAHLVVATRAGQAGPGPPLRGDPPPRRADALSRGGLRGRGGRGPRVGRASSRGGPPRTSRARLRGNRRAGAAGGDARRPRRDRPGPGRVSRPPRVRAPRPRGDRAAGPGGRRGPRGDHGEGRRAPRRPRGPGLAGAEPAPGRPALPPVWALRVRLAPLGERRGLARRAAGARGCGGARAAERGR